MCVYIKIFLAHLLCRHSQIMSKSTMRLERLDPTHRVSRERDLLVRAFESPNAKEAPVVKVGEDYFEVRLDERTEGDVANKGLLEILAEHFKVPKSRISILRGTKSRNKIVQVFLEHTADSPSHGQ